MFSQLWAEPMLLSDDMQLASRLLAEPLPGPAEKAARVAARRALMAIAKCLPAGPDRPMFADMFLEYLANAIDPGSVPKIKRFLYRAIHFRDATQRSRAARAAFHKYQDIATEVYLLNAVGKKGTSLVAKKYDMDSSQVSRICTRPDIKADVAFWFKGTTAAEAAELLERIERRGKKTSKS